MKKGLLNRKIIGLLLTAMLVIGFLPLRAYGSSLLRLEGTDCVFTYPGVGDAIRLSNASEINTSNRFSTLGAGSPDENVVVYGQTALTLLKSGLLYANRWNGNRTGTGNQVEKTLWANHSVSEPSAKNIGSTLTLSEPGYYQIPFSIGGDMHTFCVEVRIAVPDYSSYVQTLIAKYGIFPQQTEDRFPMCEESVAQGLIYAGLIDFDGNGAQELFVLYYKGYSVENDLDDLGVVYEVWSRQNGMLHMLYSNEDDGGLPFRMSDSGALSSIGLIQSDGKQYLHFRTAGSSINTKDLRDQLFTLVNGKWQKTQELIMEAIYPEEWNTPIKTIFTANGTLITEEEYLKVFINLSRWENLLITSLDNDYKLHITVVDYPAKLQAFISSLNITKTANPSTASVLVDGKRVQFQAYEIEGNNYFKLRDIAAAISGTARQFNVEWDNTQKAIKLISGAAYTRVGGELTITGAPGGNVPQNKSSLFLDGKAVSLTAYTIADNNYFKLRDIGQLLHFDVSWDGTSHTILIDTTGDYTIQ